MKKITSIFLVLILVLSFFAGCQGKQKSVITVDGTVVPNGVYRYYQMKAYNQAVDKAEDKTNILTSEIDGVPAAQWVKDRTTQLCQVFVYVEKNCEENNIVLSETAKNSAQGLTDSIWDKSEKELTDNGVSKESLLTCKMNDEKVNAIFDNLFAVDENANISDEEVEEYIIQQIAQIEYVVIPYSTNTAEFLSQEIIDENRALAEDMLQSLQNGKSFEDVVSDVPALYEVAGFSGDEIKPAKDYIITESSNLSSGTDFARLLKSMQADSYALYEDEYKAIVLKKLQTNYSDQDIEFYKAMFPAIKKQLEYNTILEDKALVLEYTFDESEYEKLSVEKLATEKTALIVA